MALPSSGQIGFDDVRIEMSQSAHTNYNMPSFSVGSWESNVYTPINVHSSNTGDYTTGSTNIALSNFYKYDLSLTYTTGSTREDLFFNVDPTILCFPSTMVVFNAGTTNQNFNLEFSGSVTDFADVATAVIYYGKPWNNNGNGYGAGDIIMTDSTLSGGMNYTSSYSYVYNADSGSNIYFTIYGKCP